MKNKKENIASVLKTEYKIFTTTALQGPLKQTNKTKKNLVQCVAHC